MEYLDVSFELYHPKFPIEAILSTVEGINWTGTNQLATA
jgi:hypothetical protein